MTAHCSTCGYRLTDLFTSRVCDRCDGLATATDTLRYEAYDTTALVAILETGWFCLVRRDRLRVVKAAGYVRVTWSDGVSDSYSALTIHEVVGTLNYPGATWHVESRQLTFDWAG